MKTYRGWPGRGVLVSDDDTGTTEPLNHIVRHSPDGFSWGFHGSGPAELAHCILVDHTGGEVEPVVYQAFKVDVIAKLRQDESWVIPEEFVTDWLRRCTAWVDADPTELDILDEEIEQANTFVHCECCDYGDTAERMTRDELGAWLCWPCAKGQSRERN